MFRAGVALTVVGLGLAAIGTLAVESMSVPLPGGWHFTLFPRGIGVLILIAGVGLMILSAVRTLAGGRTDD